MTQNNTPQAVLAGRAFKNTFDDLESGPKAQLRRTEDPMTLKPFWHCFDAARKNHQKANPSLYADTVKLLDLVTQIDSDERVGAFLARHRNRILLRRVEALFSEEHLEDLIDGLESIFILVKGSPIDFGWLVHDLSRFRFRDSRAQILRQWATEYFS